MHTGKRYTDTVFSQVFCPSNSNGWPQFNLWKGTGHEPSVWLLFYKDSCRLVHKFKCIAINIARSIIIAAILQWFH